MNESIIAGMCFAASERAMRGGFGNPSLSATRSKYSPIFIAESSEALYTPAGAPSPSAASAMAARSSAWMWFVYTSSRSSSTGVPFMSLSTGRRSAE